LEPHLDGADELVRGAPLEVEDERPGLVVHALLDLVEQAQRLRHRVALAVLLVEAGRNRVPQRRGAALLAGLLEQTQQRVAAAKGLAIAPRGAMSRYVGAVVVLVARHGRPPLQLHRLASPPDPASQV